jgi:hypothetical protein
MRPRILTLAPYIAADADVVAVSSTPAAGGIQALTLVSDPVTLDIPRQISITPVGNETARTFSIRGTDSKGNSILEAVAGGNAAATSTVRAFATVDQVLVDNDTAAAIQVGTAGTAVATNWLPLDYLQKDFQVALGLDIPTGTLTPDFTVELTLTNLLDYQGNDPVPVRGQHVAGIGGGGQFSRSLAFITPVDHDTLFNQTAAAGVISGNIAFPVRAVRLLSNTLFTVNDVSLEVVQSHHGP